MDRAEREQLSKKAEELRKLEDFEGAIAVWETIAEGFEETSAHETKALFCAELWYDLAVKYEYADRHEEAIKALDRVLALRPDKPDYL